MLKINDEEYEELRKELVTYARLTMRNCANPFILACKEAAIFFAEYWRREYMDGVHSKRMVYEALGLPKYGIDLCDKFYEAAIRGAKQLQVEVYDGDQGRMLDSILYQGGLPMELLVSPSYSYNNWDAFARGLVNRKIDFNELRLGKVARQLSGLREFCEQLVDALERDQYMLMPFHCKSEADKWYCYLRELYRQERTRQRQLHPFTLGWEIEIDKIEKRLSVKYAVRGAQMLPKRFLEDEGLTEKNFFSMEVRDNGKTVNTFDYVDGFCRYEVSCKHPYTEGNDIAIFIDDQSEPYMNEDFDMDIPHLLCRGKKGRYELGNKIGQEDSFIIIPEGWHIEEQEELKEEVYLWNEVELKGVEIPSNYQKEVVVVNGDDKIVFGESQSLYWTEVLSRPIYVPDVDEPLYDLEACKFALCHDTDEGKHSTKHVELRYRTKSKREWDDEPSYGEIYVRAIDESGHYVAPVKIKNIGGGLKINVVDADSDTCQIRISWEHGKVTTNEGTLKSNDTWEVKKEDCKSKNRICFTLVPQGNGYGQFTLSVKAPFKDFSILDINGDKVADGSFIPYADIDKYQYHLVGRNIKSYTFGNRHGQLRWLADNLFKIENGRRQKIPYEGSLLALFGSRETLRAMLDRTSKDMLHASIPVEFVLGGEESLRIEIKEYPFRARQTEDGRVEIQANRQKVEKFKSAIKLLRLDEPLHDAIVVKHDETEGYVLPEDIRDWGKTLVIGRSRGRICPAMVDLTRVVDNEYRQSNRTNAIDTISSMLKSSTIGDKIWARIVGWFNRIQKEDIPASSLLELCCVAKDARFLIYLAFSLYCNTGEDDLNMLKEQLKSMSNDLAFQWYWIRPWLANLASVVNEFIGEDIFSKEMQQLYVAWALRHGDKVGEYIGAMADKEKYTSYFIALYTEKMTAFSEWMYELCAESLLESYTHERNNELAVSMAKTIVRSPKNICRVEVKSIQYVPTNQDDLYEATAMKEFFAQYKEAGLMGNELWMYKRVNAVVDHLKENIDLFEESEDIRRSVIFCSKSCNTLFIETLNNKISNCKNEIR